MKRLLLALLLLSPLPISAVAKDAFPDLPGVRDPDRAKPKVDVPDCESAIVVPWPNATVERNGLGYRAYGCAYGNVTVGSNRPPNLIEYRKYKERYQE